MPARRKPIPRPERTGPSAGWYKEVQQGNPFYIEIHGSPSGAYTPKTLLQHIRNRMAAQGTIALMRSKIKRRDGRTKTILELASETWPESFPKEQVDLAKTSFGEACKIAWNHKRGFWVRFILKKADELYHNQW